MPDTLGFLSKMEKNPTLLTPSGVLTVTAPSFLILHSVQSLCEVSKKSLRGWVEFLMSINAVFNLYA